MSLLRESSATLPKAAQLYMSSRFALPEDYVILFNRVIKFALSLPVFLLAVAGMLEC